MISATNLDHVAPTNAARCIQERGYYVFPNVLSASEIESSRTSTRAFFKTGGRLAEGGGKKQANAAVEVPAIQWLYYHPRVLACFREALGTDTIMFTSHADLHKDLLGGWHKDDGTDPARPDFTGYFDSFAYDSDECKVYKMAVYLQSHDHDNAGLHVRVGSHRIKSHTDGDVVYTRAASSFSMCALPIPDSPKLAFSTGLCEAPRREVRLIRFSVPLGWRTEPRSGANASPRFLRLACPTNSPSTSPETTC